MEDLGLLVLRVVVGLTFAAHGAQKAFGWWGGPGWAGFRGWIASMNVRPATAWAAVAVAAELGGGLALALGVLTPFAAAALIGQSVGIIGLVHLANGFWNGKGGIEFPLTLAGGVAAVALVGAGRLSVDAAVGFALAEELVAGLLVIGILGGLVAVAISRLARRETTAAA